MDVAGIEPALQYTRMFFGRVTTSHSHLYCLTISRPFVTSEESNLIPVGSHSHYRLVKTFTYFSTKPDLVPGYYVIINRIFRHSRHFLTALRLDSEILSLEVLYASQILSLTVTSTQVCYLFAGFVNIPEFITIPHQFS